MKSLEARSSKRQPGSNGYDSWSPDYQNLTLAILGIIARLASLFLLDTSNPESDIGRQFLLNRGVGLNEVHEFDIGFLSANVPFRVLCDRYATLSDRKTLDHEYAEGIMQRTLLLKKVAKDLYPVRGDALVFPEFSLNGRVANLFMRHLDLHNPKTPKFAGLRGIGKDTTSFGLRNAVEAITLHKTVIIVEGPFDVLSLVRGVNPGLNIAVAPVGCFIFEKLLKSLITSTGCDRIVLSLDGDNAGVNATASAVERFYHQLEDQGVSIGWLRWSAGCDPDDLLSKRDAELRSKILTGVIAGQEFTIHDENRKDGILCRYIPRANCSTVAMETCVDLGIDLIQIARSDGEKRGKSDFALMRMRCNEQIRDAQVYEGRGISLPRSDYEAVLTTGKFSVLATFLVLSRAVAKGIPTIPFASIRKQTSLEDMTIIRALNAKVLRTLFTLRVDAQNRCVHVEPSERLLRYNYQLRPNLLGLSADAANQDEEPPDDVEWWVNTDG